MGLQVCLKNKYLVITSRTKFDDDCVRKVEEFTHLGSTKDKQGVNKPEKKSRKYERPRKL